MKKLVFILVAIAAIFGIQSCKKGCTDNTAFNYVKGVKHDDGSCLYCDSTTAILNFGYCYGYDRNSSSTYFNQNVLLIEVAPHEIVYSGNGCKQLGLANNESTDCTNMTLVAILTNETGATLVTSGNIYTAVGNGSLTITLSSLSIRPNGQDTIVLGTVCGSNSFNPQVTLENYSFQYH